MSTERSDELVKRVKQAADNTARLRDRVRAANTPEEERTQEASSEAAARGEEISPDNS